MRKVIDGVATTPAGGRNDALNHAAVEDALCAAAEQTGLVADDGARQCWETIRSGLSKGLQQPKDLAADERAAEGATSSCERGSAPRGAYMDGVIRNLEGATRPGRNNALNGAAWTLGHWIAAGALVQSDVEEALYAAAVANGLVADDGERQCWATIRSGLDAGLQQPVDLDATGRAPRRGRTA